MMFTKNQIDKFLEIHAAGDNQDHSVIKHAKLKHRLIEAKCLIDRWGTMVSTDVIFHSSKKDTVRQELGSDLDSKVPLDLSKIVEIIKKHTALLKSHLQVDEALKVIDGVSKEDMLEMSEKLIGKDPVDTMCGLTFHYSDDCPIDSSIMLALPMDFEDEFVGRYVSTLPM